MLTYASGSGRASFKMKYAYDAKIGTSSLPTRYGCDSVYGWSCVLVISPVSVFSMVVCHDSFVILKVDACGFRLIQRFPVR